MRDLLRLRDVRLLLAGQGLSWVGDAFNPIALSVAVVLGGGGAGELGVVLASAVVAPAAVHARRRRLGRPRHAAPDHGRAPT